MRPAHETSDMLYMVHWIHMECPSDPTCMGRFKLEVEIEEGDVKKSIEFHTQVCVTDMALMVWNVVMQGMLPEPSSDMLLEPEGMDIKHRLLIVRASTDVPARGAIFKGEQRVPLWQNEGNRLDVVLEAIHEFNNFI